MPGARRGRLGGLGRVPERQRRSALPRGRRRRDLQVPALSTDAAQGRIRRRVPLLLRHDGVAHRQGVAPAAASTSCRPATRPTSSGRSGCSSGPGRHPVRLRPARPLPRAVRVTVSRRLPPAATAAALLLERRTYRAADHVIATNESYRGTAIERGGKRPDEVTVVRTGPDAEPHATESRRSGAATRSALPGRLHRRHGPAGRRRHRRSERPTTIVHRARARRHRLHADGNRATASTSWSSSARRAGACATTSSSPAGCPTTSCSRVLSTADVGFVARPEEPAQRRVDDEQDHGVHGVRPAGRRLRPP